MASVKDGRVLGSAELSAKCSAADLAPQGFVSEGRFARLTPQRNFAAAFVQ
jgi:hypothetical protein